MCLLDIYSDILHSDLKFGFKKELVVVMLFILSNLYASVTFLEVLLLIFVVETFQKLLITRTVTVF